MCVSSFIDAIVARKKSLRIANRCARIEIDARRTSPRNQYVDEIRLRFRGTALPPKETNMPGMKSYQKGTTQAQRVAKEKAQAAGRTRRATARAKATPKAKPYTKPMDAKKYQSTKGLGALAKKTKAARAKKKN